MWQAAEVGASALQDWGWVLELGAAGLGGAEKDTEREELASLASAGRMREGAPEFP